MYWLEKLSKVTIPRNIFITQAQAPKLYKLEEKRDQLIQECGKEWMKVLKIKDENFNFWHVAIPQILFDILENFQKESAIIAAKTFLEKYGFKVSRTDEP